MLFRSEVLCAASEFDDLPLRKGEEQLLRQQGQRCHLKISRPIYHDVHTKANILLQSHFSRLDATTSPTLTTEMMRDMRDVVIDAHRLLSAMIDVLSSAGWLMPALACMEMSQMVIQGMWDSVSPLCILPHFTPDLLARAEEMGVESILDLPELQPPQQELLFQGLGADQVAEIAETCNRYPNVDLTFTPLPDQLTAGQQVSLHCNIVRDLDEDEEIPNKSC